VEKNSFRILIADDFEIVRIMLREGLQELGYSRVDEAEDGRQALAMIDASAAEGQPYSLVFCDWIMPEMEGIDVLEACKDRPETMKIPFVMVTAESERKAIVRAMRAGAHDYIVKPISKEDLAKKVNSIIARAKSSAA
jgi:two-component system chemotaxis response regulator CheY